MSDPETLVSIALACRDGERLRFGYLAATGARTARHVEPLRLVSMSRRWYLVAYDLDRHDWRSFRMDRIDGPGPRGSGSALASCRPRTPRPLCARASTG